MHSSINSAIYTGWVAHARFAPKPHRFQYRAFMMYLDLDELPTLFNDARFWSFGKRNLAWFKRADYFGDADKPLKQCISDLLLSHTGQPALGAVCLLTNMRYFGHCFNPVSFYYCFQPNGELQAIVSHITNTPWGEDYAYVHDFFNKNISDEKLHHFQFEKDFHVSPFMPMQIQYDWTFQQPDDKTFVHMKNFEHGQEIFNATLSLQRQAITPAKLNALLWQFPVMTMKVVAAIYWNALLLWLKRVPFYDHPKPHFSNDKASS